MQRFVTFVLMLLGIAFACLIAVFAYQSIRAHTTPELRAPFHAVLMMNGQAYFGRLERLGTTFPLLRDVYYVRSQVNPETKEVTNSLVKRGQEWHAPDFMLLNASQILLIEPVKPGSRMSKLIEESAKEGSGAPKQ